MILDDEEISARVFFPRRVPPPDEIPGKLDVLSFPLPETGALGCLFFTNDPALPTLLLFHGNGEIVHDYIDIAPMYMHCGVNLAVVDYRGYGFSDLQPSFGSLFNDSYIAYRGLHEHLEKKGFNNDVFILGRSLGSTCAAELGANPPPGLKGIIFESGFGDLFNIMNRLFGVGVLMGITRDKVIKWSNDTRVKQFSVPVLIIHGTNDYIIPVTEADVLYNAIPPGITKEKVIIEGAGHNDILLWESEYFPPITQFIKKQRYSVRAN